jgi:hypothetical protein
MMVCSYCGKEIEDEDCFPVRELIPDCRPRLMSQVIPVDKYGLETPRWVRPLKTKCAKCFIEAMEGQLK